MAGYAPTSTILNGIKFRSDHYRLLTSKYEQVWTSTTYCFLLFADAFETEEFDADLTALGVTFGDLVFGDKELLPSDV